MQVLILLALIVLNGLFAMAEIALVTARKARLQKWIDEGDSAAQAALKLGEDPTRFLSAIQIGITTIGVLNGVFGEAALAQPLAQWLQQWGLVAQRLGQARPERVARLVARPVHWLAQLPRPFVFLLSVATQLLLRLLGVRDHVGQGVTDDEIHAVLAEGTHSGAIEAQEHRMVRNLFRLDDRQISSLMVQRMDVVCLDIHDSPAQQLDTIAAHDHARFPVIDKKKKKIVGVLNARQWLLPLNQHGHDQLHAEHALLDKPIYIPETITGLELLE